MKKITAAKQQFELCTKTLNIKSQDKLITTADTVMTAIQVTRVESLVLALSENAIYDADTKKRKAHACKNILGEKVWNEEVLPSIREFAKTLMRKI